MNYFKMLLTKNNLMIGWCLSHHKVTTTVHVCFWSAKTVISVISVFSINFIFIGKYFSTASHKTYIRMCQLYSRQLEDDGLYHRATSYLLTINDVYGAIKLLQRHSLYR